MPYTYLVTGANGFAGAWLCRTLESRGHNVVALDIQEHSLHNQKDYVRADISNADALYTLLSDYSLNGIFHLAAVANPRLCAQDPALAVKVNILGTVNLFDYCRANTACRIVVVGSSEEYKKTNKAEYEFVEDYETDPSSVYGLTKKSAEDFGLLYARSYGIDVVFTRAFNHTGPGQTADYVISSFARQVAAIAAKEAAPEILVGNLDVQRDFSDVRDVVNGYLAVMEHGRTAETYNIASGRAYKLQDLLDTLTGFSGTTGICITADPGRMRANEPLVIKGNINKIQSHTGWRPQIPINQTLKDLYEYWLAKMKFRD